MSLSYSTDRTDETGRELLTYGTPDFPISFFDDDLAVVKVMHCTTMFPHPLGNMRFRSRP